MRKTAIYTAAALILASFIGISCQKEMSETAEGTPVTVIGTINDDGATKVALSENTTLNVIKTAWENNDNIIGWDESGNTLELKIDGADRITDDGKAAIFTLVDGALPTTDGSKIFMIYAPDKRVSDLVDDDDDKSLTYILSSQPADKVPALMTAIGTLTERQIRLTFVPSLAIVAVKNPKLKLPSSVAETVTELKLSGGNVKSSVSLSLANSDFTLNASGGNSVTKACNFSTAEDGTVSDAIVYFAVPPSESSADVTISTSNPPGYEIVKENASFAAGRCYMLSGKDAERKVFTITIPTVDNGSFTTTPSGSVAWGNSVTITADPTNPTTDYELTPNSITVTKAGGGNVSPLSGTGPGPYTFTMPQDNVTVTGAFQKKKYTLSSSVTKINSETPGSVTMQYTTDGTPITSGTDIEWGPNITVTATAFTYYSLDKIKIGTSDITAAPTFDMPKANTTVNVTFNKCSYTISTGSMINGTFNVSHTSRQWGETVTVTASPSANYSVATMTYTDGSATKNIIISGNTGTFPMPKSATTVNVTFKENDTGTIGGHDYVKIGNTKWATCNVGAASPTGYGWYFSWGNVQGYTRNGSNWVEAGKSSPTVLSGGFSSDNYDSTPGHGCSSNIPANTTYDAAQANWGDKWRMPTKEEFKNLYDVCGGTGTSKPNGSTATTAKGVYWCTNYNNSGVNGLLFCDGVGHKVFFPAAGYGYDTSLYNAGSNGRYWSSSLSTGYTDDAYYLRFNSDDVFPQNYYNRYLGFSVRPVSD